MSSIGFERTDALARPRTQGRLGAATAGVRRFIRYKPLGAIGAIILLGYVFVALLAPAIAPHDPYTIQDDATFMSPSREFLMGTDNFGRDVFSRVLYGARISLYVGLLSVGIGTTLGLVVGLTSGYYGGRFDFVAQRVVDMFQSFPALILALAVVAALGASINNVVVAIAAVTWPGASRVIRSGVLSLRQTTYVEAARALGCSHLRILARHILPNVIPVYIVLVTAYLGTAITTEASLSFLGLGTPPPTPSWGAMLSGAAQRYATVAPWMAIFPGLALSLAVFAFNFVGDALRDVLDPRLRGR